jgi:SsrA-binding protein
MHKAEIRRLIGKVEQKGFTLVPLNLHYKDGRVKAEIALAKGKAEHDKRETEKKRDWVREHGRLMRHKVSSGGNKG